MFERCRQLGLTVFKASAVLPDAGVVYASELEQMLMKADKVYGQRRANGQSFWDSEQSENDTHCARLIMIEARSHAKLNTALIAEWVNLLQNNPAAKQMFDIIEKIRIAMEG